MTRTSLVILVVVAVLFVLGFGLSLWSAWRTCDWMGLALNVGTEMMGAAVLYFILERVLERRERREEEERKASEARDARKRHLISQLGSSVHDVAVAAAEELKRKGWLTDGSLRDAILWRANLKGADLNEANLEGVTLWGANLEDALLFRATLEGANLYGVNLRGAYLVEANLRGAHLEGANLVRAMLDDSVLSRVSYDDGTLWPTGFTPPPDAVRIHGLAGGLVGAEPLEWDE